jgi:predicted nuclease of predicted toxin-antitoxin system
VKILIDMNLPPLWAEHLKSEGFEAIHWSLVGDPRASDREVLSWASKNGYVVFTHDLDFGSLLAVTNASGPSVVQTRAQDVTPEAFGSVLLALLRVFPTELRAGALITVDESGSRLRLLPIRR